MSTITVCAVARLDYVPTLHSLCIYSRLVNMVHNTAYRTHCRLVHIYHCVSGLFDPLHRSTAQHIHAEDVRPVSYKYWDPLDMEQAMAAVEQTGTSIREAAKMFSVPPSTLYDRVSGKVSHGKKSGPIPYLTFA